MTESLRYELRHAAAYLTLTQAERGNPFDLALAKELRRAVARCAEDDARVVVLEAEGPRFSVGGDIAAFGAAEEPGSFMAELADTFHATVLTLFELNAIVVSVVRGTAAGAGLPLAAAADIVLASEDARFTLAYTRIGLTPDGGSSLLTTTVGLHRALAWALLNPVLSAHDLLAAGLVTGVYPNEDLDVARDRVVATLLAGSRSAQVGAKRLLRSRTVPNPADTLAAETRAIAHAADTADGREGVRAFLDKRPPMFMRQD
jgi:2-(1,2-epoxy-1,2-dihydrophenyl)acetyl-CoA isomerase